MTESFMVKALFCRRRLLLLLGYCDDLVFHLRRRRCVMRKHREGSLRACPRTILALDATKMVDRPRTCSLIDCNRSARAVPRAHAAQNACCRIDGDRSLESTRRLFRLKRIQKGLGLFEHARERHLSKMEQSHVTPTFPCS